MALSATETRGVGLFALENALAATLFVFWSFAPTTDALPDAPSARFELLASVLVLFLAAHVCLVHFDRAIEQAAVLVPTLADPVRHEPRRSLRDVKVAMQLYSSLPILDDYKQVYGMIRLWWYRAACGCWFGAVRNVPRASARKPL